MKKPKPRENQAAPVPNPISSGGCLGEHPKGVLFLVRAQPGARKQGFLGMVGSEAKLAVSAPPEDGKANEALVELVASLFGLRKSSITLVQGKSSRQKRFLIEGMALEEARERWSSVIQPKSEPG